MKVYIVDNVNCLDLKGKRELKKQTLLVLRHLNLSNNTEVCITLVDDAAMRSLNETYRGIKRTTDVLSFSQHERDFQGLNAAIALPFNTYLLGDIVISINAAQRNSQRYKNSLKEEIQKLIVHGTLHLLGYDHKKKKDAEKMKKKEEELKKIIQSSQTAE